METFEKIAKLIETEYHKNGMKWLSGVGYTGMVAGPILAAVRAVRAYKEIEKRKKERNTEELPFKETAGIIAKNAIAPVAITGITIYSTAKVQHDLSDALTTALVLGDNKIRELKEAEKEVVGEEKSEEIQKKADEKAIEKEEIEHLPIDPLRGIYPAKCEKTGQMWAMSEHQFNEANLMLRENTLSGQNVYLSEFLEWCGGEACSLGWEYYWPAAVDAQYRVYLDVIKDKYGRPAYLLKYCGISDPILAEKNA